MPGLFLHSADALCLGLYSARMSNHPFPWREAFLASLRDRPIVQCACDAVGINRSTAYRARKDDEAFAEAWDDAMETGIDRAEAEAFRRGVVGFQEPVIHQGRLQFVYERYLDDEGKEQWRLKLDANGQPVPLTVTKASDAMLSLYLKGRRRAFSTERTELTGADGGALQVDESKRAARIAQLMAIAQQRKDNPVDDDFI